jgi:hypothetical protein
LTLRVTAAFTQRSAMLAATIVCHAVGPSADNVPSLVEVYWSGTPLAATSTS